MCTEPGTPAHKTQPKTEQDLPPAYPARIFRIKAGEVRFSPTLSAYEAFGMMYLIKIRLGTHIRRR